MQLQWILLPSVLWLWRSNCYIDIHHQHIFITKMPQLKLSYACWSSFLWHNTATHHVCKKFPHSQHSPNHCQLSQLKGEFLLKNITIWLNMVIQFCCTEILDCWTQSFGMGIRRVSSILPVILPSHAIWCLSIVYSCHRNRTTIVKRATSLCFHNNLSVIWNYFAINCT